MIEYKYESPQDIGDSFGIQTGHLTIIRQAHYNYCNLLGLVLHHHILLSATGSRADIL
jgi:hypothetical protein